MNTSTDQPSAAKEIFFAAMEIDDPEEKVHYVDLACQANESLRVEVLNLIAANPETVGNGFAQACKQLNSELFNVSAAAPPTSSLAETTLDPSQHPIIGRYKVLEEIGRGGMGTVYMAQQTEPVKRRVALKVINPGMDSREVIARFEAERQALAMMEHPNIARVFDGGATEQGRPYFVMELVRGVPITEYCDRHNLSLEGRMQLFIEVCQAVQHAHQKGIIHRDLKPSNVQVTHDDGAPVVKVIDFGVAKALHHTLTDHTLFTQFSQLVGTPLYMSPEQADRHGFDVDTRSDVYSLGVLLYELLTGITPFDRNELSDAGVDDVRRMICELEPLRPSVRVSTLKANDDSTLRVKSAQSAERHRRCLALRGDLDWIVMKALEKRRDDRYESASALAQDIQRHLNHEPIEARPPTPLTRLAKWSRRHVSLVWGALAGLLFLAIGLGISTAFIAASRSEAQLERDTAEEKRLQAERASQEAIKQRNIARRNQYYAEMTAGGQQIGEENYSGLYTHLVDYLPVLDEEDLRDWEWYYLLARCRPEERTIYDRAARPFAAWSSDGELIGTPGGIWRADTGDRLHRFMPSSILRYRVAWSPDGQKFAWAMTSDEDCFYVWDRDANQVTRFGINGVTNLTTLAWSPDGTQIVSGGWDSRIRVWDVATQTELWSVATKHGVWALAWSPDGKQICVGNFNNGIKVLDAANGELLRHFEKKDGGLCVAWHPAGDRIAVTSQSRCFILNANDLSILQEHPISDVNAISYNHDGSLLAVGHGLRVSVFDSQFKEVTRFTGHTNDVCAVSWSPDDRKLLSSDNLREVKIWGLKAPEQPLVIETKSPLAALDWSEGNVLHGVTSLGSAHHWWDARDGQVLRKKSLAVQPDYLSRNGQHALVRREDGVALEVYNETDQSVSAVLQLDPQRTFRRAAISDDGSRAAILTDGKNTSVESWDVQKERVLWRWTFRDDSIKGRLDSLAWSDDGKWLAIVGGGEHDGGPKHFGQFIHVFSDPQQTRVAVLPVDEDVVDLAWRKDGQALAVATNRGNVQIYDLRTRKSLFESRVHATELSAITWHPDSRRLACGTSDGVVRIISADRGTALLTLRTPGATPVTQLDWSEDGERLAAANEGGQIVVWDASRAYRLIHGEQRRGELAWMYRDRAEPSSTEQRSAAIQEFVRFAPDRLAYWEERGTCLAQLHEFERAADEFAKGTDANPKLSFYQLWLHAYALLANGRRDEFHRACAQLVELFGDSPVPSTRGIVAWLCTLSPNSVVDMEQVLLMADFALEGADDLEPNAVYRGACLYRLGRREEAVTELTRIAEMLDRGGTSYERYNLACANYLLSLARHDLGNDTQAQRLLDEANDLIDGLPENFLWYEWRRRADLEVLREEASAALAK